MLLLPITLDHNSKKYPCIVFQSSLAQSSLPILRSVLSGSNSRRRVLFCLLYPPSSLVDAQEQPEVHDWMNRIPGYDDTDKCADLVSIAEKSLKEASQPIDIIVDSLDTLLADVGSLSVTYNMLSQVMVLIKEHPNARLILHTQSPSALLPLITSTSFSASLAHIIAHPPALIRHVATAFLMPPPPLSPLPKFWGVFLPVSERIHDTERLVFGAGGEGSGHPSEIVVEMIVRDASGRKRGVERVLEGWLSNHGSCELVSLESLNDLVKKQKEQIFAPDPTQNLSFNLNLTSSQQESRAQVPLPYAHEGKAIPNPTQATIFYDPDSADDIDDDDPDEDLDI